MDRDAANRVTHGARHGVGHGCAVAEALAEDARPIDAKLTLELGDQLARKRDVGSAGVGPAIVEPLGRDENGAPLGQIP